MICSCRKVLLHHRKSQLISIGRRCVSVTPFSRRAERWGCRGLPDQVNRTGPALLRSNLLDQCHVGLLVADAFSLVAARRAVWRLSVAWDSLL